VSPRGTNKHSVEINEYKTKKLEDETMVRFEWNTVMNLMCRLGLAVFTLMMISGITKYGWLVAE